jgi:hypothetical protein
VIASVSVCRSLSENSSPATKPLPRARTTRWSGYRTLWVSNTHHAHSEKLKRRIGIGERSMDQGYFPTRGLSNAGTEMSLSVLVYDLLRAISILGVPRMTRALA